MIKLFKLCSFIAQPCPSSSLANTNTSYFPYILETWISYASYFDPTRRNMKILLASLSFLIWTNAATIFWHCRVHNTLGSQYLKILPLNPGSWGRILSRGRLTKKSTFLALICRKLHNFEHIKSNYISYVNQKKA